MMTKTQVTSLAILALVKEGMEPVAAMRVVLGAALVDGMIAELYDTLRAASYSAHAVMAGQAVQR